jgi:hypothetical protein
MTRNQTNQRYRNELDQVVDALVDDIENAPAPVGDAAAEQVRLANEARAIFDRVWNRTGRTYDRVVVSQFNFRQVKSEPT